MLAHGTGARGGRARCARRCSRTCRPPARSERIGAVVMFSHVGPVRARPRGEPRVLRRGARLRGGHGPRRQRLAVGDAPAPPGPGRAPRGLPEAGRTSCSSCCRSATRSRCARRERPITEPGLTHLSFGVDDLDADVRGGGRARRDGVRGVAPRRPRSSSPTRTARSSSCSPAPGSPTACTSSSASASSAERRRDLGDDLVADVLAARRRPERPVRDDQLVDARRRVGRDLVGDLGCVADEQRAAGVLRR